MQKIVLLHGWNYDNYYGKVSDAWANRSIFVEELEKQFEVYYMDLPGFGSEKTPNAKMWNLSDYATFVEAYLNEKEINPDYILGYSFGGAVAVRWKSMFNHDTNLVLVSPAIIRNNEGSRSYFSTPKIMNPIRYKLRDLYLVYKVKNKEMIHGNSFHRATYQSIVREDLLDEVQSIDPRDLLIVYGDEDNMVNPIKVLNTVNDELKERIHLIQGGAHDIGNTNPKEIIDIINGGYKQKKKR